MGWFFGWDRRKDLIEHLLALLQSYEEFRHAYLDWATERREDKDVGECFVDMVESHEVLERQIEAFISNRPNDELTRLLLHIQARCEPE